MTIKKRSLITLTIIASSLTTLTGVAWAQNNKGSDKTSTSEPREKSKVGAEFTMISPTALSAKGVLYGWRYVGFESPSFTIGGAGYTGQISSTTEVGSISYGGLVAGYIGNLTRKSVIELTLLAGGGGGSFGTTSGNGVVIQPRMEFAFVFGPTVRLALTGGYFWMPASADFSSVTYGLRFDFVQYVLE